MAYEDLKHVMRLRERLKQKRQEFSEVLLTKGYRCAANMIHTLYCPNGEFDKGFKWLEQLPEYKTKVDQLNLNETERRVFSHLYLAYYEYIQLRERFQISE